jgi:hypothetical protein
MNLGNPLNDRVLAYLSGSGNRIQESVPPASVQDPYYSLGSHPDVVERVWDVLGKSLPEDCRWVVRGTPALVHPRTGVVFALALGTRYALRLTEDTLGQALLAGAPTEVQWTSGGELNAPSDLGEEWVLGSWLKGEMEWCQKAFEEYGKSGSGWCSLESG